MNIYKAQEKDSYIPLERWSSHLFPSPSSICTLYNIKSSHSPTILKWRRHGFWSSRRVEETSGALSFQTSGKTNGYCCFPEQAPFWENKRKTMFPRRDAVLGIKTQTDSSHTVQRFPEYSFDSNVPDNLRPLHFIVSALLARMSASLILLIRRQIGSTGRILRLETVYWVSQSSFPYERKHCFTFPADMELGIEFSILAVN